MKYLLLTITDDSAWSRMTGDEQERMSLPFREYQQELRASGVLVGNYRPGPSTEAKSVRASSGKVEVLDGPAIPRTEQVTGVYVIEVPDLKTALTWAERNPAARFGTVEVRAAFSSGAEAKQYADSQHASG